MNLKKIVIKTMAIAMTFGFVSLVNVGTAKAAAAAVTFDGVKEQIKVTGYTHWGVAKEVDEKKKDFTVGTKHYKVDEVLEVVGGSIDLSFLSKGKDAIIAVGKKEVFTTEGAWTVKEIAKQNKSFKVGFVSKKEASGKVSFNGVEIVNTDFIDGNEFGTLAATDGETAAAYNLKTAKKVEAKLGNGDWQMLNVLFGAGEDDAITDANNKADPVFATLLQNGSTVSFRIPGSDSAWPSKEVKVKFEKQKKAPRLTVDTTKGVVNFKKGQEYKVTRNTTEDTNWNVATGKMTFKDLNITGEVDVKIKVRDAAKDKKVASKIGEITLTKQAKVDVSAITTTGDFIAGKLSLNMKVPYDIKKGAEILNKDKDNEYEYFIIDNNSAEAVPPVEAKWHKIKAAKENKKKVVVPGKSSLKFSKDLSKGNAYGETNTNLKIFVRTAGTKQDKTTGNAKLPGLTNKDNGKATLVIADSKGSITAEATTTVAGNPKKEYTSSIAISTDKLFKDGYKPKVKITEKLSGVSVKVSKLKKAGTGGSGTITVKASKSAFKDVGNFNFKFTVTIEGVSKDLTVTYNITK